MKPKRYSESKIKNAQKFLSDYKVTFESLDEQRKNMVVHYIDVRKYSGLCLFIFIAVLIICSFGVYAFYNHSMLTINDIAEASASSDNIILHMDCKLLLVRGFLIGILAFTALMMILYMIFLPMILKSKRQFLCAFLPSLNNPTDNEKCPNN